jgi:hypothetical protein
MTATFEVCRASAEAGAIYFRGFAFLDPARRSFS